MSEFNVQDKLSSKLRFQSKSQVPHSIARILVQINIPDPRSCPGVGLISRSEVLTWGQSLRLEVEVQVIVPRSRSITKDQVWGQVQHHRQTEFHSRDLMFKSKVHFYVQGPVWDLRAKSKIQAQVWVSRFEVQVQSLRTRSLSLQHLRLRSRSKIHVHLQRPSPT